MRGNAPRNSACKAKVRPFAHPHKLVAVVGIAPDRIVLMRHTCPLGHLTAVKLVVSAGTAPASPVFQAGALLLS